MSIAQIVLILLINTLISPQVYISIAYVMNRSMNLIMEIISVQVDTAQEKCKFYILKYLYIHFHKFEVNVFGL